MQLPNDIIRFLKVPQSSNFTAFVVGGAVRDLIGGRSVTDWDFTTSATPDEILKMFPESYYNNTYGTVTVKWEIDGKSELFEITPFRSESKYLDNRHPDLVSWAKTVEEDLSRRDFTINAMAYDGNTLIDPFGGKDDLKNGVIKAVGESDKRFSEDALRLLRAVRFAAQLGFKIEEDTRSSIIKNSHLIKNVSWERIQEEFLKILATDHPAEGVLFLKNTGLLHYILPELERCFSVPQKSPKRHHIYDVGTHLIMSLKNCDSKNIITRFATLIHDIGKEKTFHKDPSTHIITFYNHEVVGTKIAEEIADRFKLSNKQKELLVRLVSNHQFVVSEEMTDNAIRRFIRNVGIENLDEMFALRRADRLGGAASETSWRTELFKKRVAELLIEPFTVKDLKIDGNDVMSLLNLKPSRQIGEILDALFAKVENKELANEKNALVEEILKYKKG